MLSPSAATELAPFEARAALHLRRRARGAAGAGAAVRARRGQRRRAAATPSSARSRSRACSCCRAPIPRPSPPRSSARRSPSATSTSRRCRPPSAPELAALLRGVARAGRIESLETPRAWTSSSCARCCSPSPRTCASCSSSWPSAWSTCARITQGGRSGAARRRAPDARALRAARQPPGRLRDEVGAGGLLLPLHRARALQEDRAAPRREAQRPRGLHPARDRAAARRAGGHGHPRRDPGAARSTSTRSGERCAARTCRSSASTTSARCA